MKFALLEIKCSALAHLWLLSIAKLHAPEAPKSSFLKIDCCAQEADETQLWLELLTEKCSVPPQKTDSLIKETNELISIFVTMSKRTKANKSTNKSH